MEGGRGAYLGFFYDTSEFFRHQGFLPGDLCLGFSPVLLILLQQPLAFFQSLSCPRAATQRTEGGGGTGRRGERGARPKSILAGGKSGGEMIKRYNRDHTYRGRVEKLLQGICGAPSQLTRSATS